MSTPATLTAWILVGGRLTPSPALTALPRPDLVVAADGGARHAAALGIKVDAWVGDFDSSAGVRLDAPTEVHPTAKDETDAELAVNIARQHRATRLVFLGAFGGRFDHAAALLLGGLRLSLEGLDVCLTSGDEWAWPLHPSQSQELTLPRATTLSVIAVSELRGLSLRGVRWPLDRASIPLGSGRTVSNETMRETVCASVQDGLALITALTGDGPHL